MKMPSINLPDLKESKALFYKLYAKGFKFHNIKTARWAWDKHTKIGMLDTYTYYSINHYTKQIYVSCDNLSRDVILMNSPRQFIEYLDKNNITPNNQDA